MLVQTSGGLSFAAALVVNAAGLWSDDAARLAGDDLFTLNPRKGQFIIVEEDHGVSQIILPVPTGVSKGILVTPIVFGGILLGLTAEEVDLLADFATTASAIGQIRRGVSKLLAVADAASVRQFAGLRAVSSTGEYIIRTSTAGSRLLHVAGIRSTGLSASPAIGRYVGNLVQAELGLTLKESFIEELPEYLAEALSRRGRCGVPLPLDHARRGDGCSAQPAAADHAGWPQAAHGSHAGQLPGQPLPAAPDRPLRAETPTRPARAQ